MLVCLFWLVFRTGSLITDVLPVSLICAVLVVVFSTGSLMTDVLPFSFIYAVLVGF